MKFTHLHVHSHYSLLDGLAKISDLVEYAKADGAEALALTDHGVMYGAIEFYQKCMKAGIKPIIGVEAYLAPHSRFDKNTKDDEKRNYHLTLLARDLAGYKNLVKLTSIAHLEGFYYKPRIDWEVLEKHSEGLIAGSACLAGEIPRLITAGKLDRARERILAYNELFGQDNFYLELQPHPQLDEQETVNRELIKFSRELGIPLIATNDIHYLKPEDYDVQDVLLCLQTKNKKDESDRFKMEGQDFYYKTAREMKEAFKEVPEAIANTAKIAEKCNLELELGKIQLPYFVVPEGFDDNSYLRKLSQEGLVSRYGKTYENIDGKIRERLDYELEVIGKMGFPSYFLIVADFVNWAKDNGIVVGPGRGSAAGSLVSYVLNITNIDPLVYDLVFERFLNPDRISMPDIDLDFTDTRRDEVIRYVEEKYGKDHVAQIITFGTMAARAAVRDVGRVLNYPYDYCDRLAKMIPMFSKIDEALKTTNELKEIYRDEEAAKKILDYARRLEGVARHASTHACGVLITKEPLTDHVPLQIASSSDKSIVSQYSLHPIEDLGLLKMDFLGLKNLTIIESAINIIKNTRGLAIDIDKIPLDDKRAFKLFQTGETTGVFQFESSGMKRYLRELKPTVFEDIIAMVALYRPGPMEWIPDYIASKKGKKKPSNLHPKLEPILAITYGVAIYQEQVMQITRDLAGFSMAEADVLRKAVGKKIPKLLAEQKEKFIDGCVKNGINDSLAGKIFSFIEPFAGYGFNRSHAACYAMIAYQTAYLKVNWPTEFMAALLTADQQNTDRITIEIEECRRMGIEVSQPDINQSFESFTVVTSGTEANAAASSDEQATTIRFGLKAIKNIGAHIAEEIIRERKDGGPYKTITDFLERVGDKDLNKKSLESLIKSGCLERFAERGQLLGNIEDMLAFHKQIHKSKSNGQVSLFADAPGAGFSHEFKLKAAAPAGRQEKLSWEKELLGLYVTEHPLSDYRDYLENRTIPLHELKEHRADSQVTVAGIITKIQKIVTRTNETMLFTKIEDTISNIEVLVFPRLLKDTPTVWEEGRVVLCQGKLSNKDQELKLLANRAVNLNLENAEKTVKSFAGNSYNHNNGNSPAKPKLNPGPGAELKAPAPDTDNKNAKNDAITIIIDGRQSADLAKLKDLLLKFKGGNRVYFKLKQNGQEKTIASDLYVENNRDLVESINKNFGSSFMIEL